MAYLVISDDLIEIVKMTRVDDKELNALMEKSKDIKVDDIGIVRFRGWLSVSNDKEVKKSILVEVHCFKFSLHPRVKKMYLDLKRTY